MQIFGRVAMLAAASLLAAACASSSHESAKLDAAGILADGPETGSENQAETAGRTSMAHGDAWTATRLFKRAAEANNTPLNRFNLAAGYQNTGRLKQAAELYRTVEHDGKYVWVVGNNDLNDPTKALTRFNLAEESGRRLLVIADLLAAPKAKRAALMKNNIGGIASTQVGGPTAGAVSDTRAADLDVKAEAVRDQ